MYLYLRVLQNLSIHRLSIALPFPGSADFSGECNDLSKDFLESEEEVFGVCNPSEVGSKKFDLGV